MNKRIFQLKIDIKGIEPPVSRTILVEDSITFYKLHEIIQAIFSWFDYHLHEFKKGEYGEIKILDTLDEDYKPPIEQNDKFFSVGKNILAKVKRVDYEETQVKINRFLRKEGASLLYIYDFGDWWEHNIKLEKILDFDEKIKYPVCIEGLREAPPEDIGGHWGYEDFLKAINDPSDSSREEYSDEFLESFKGFDPEYFDIDKINKKLKKVKKD